MTKRYFTTRERRPVTVTLHGNVVRLPTYFEARLVDEKTWRCDRCKKVDQWGPGWVWYGPASEDDCLALACSSDCMKALREASGGTLP